jgi:micrococcal nuclease
VLPPGRSRLLATSGSPLADHASASTRPEHPEQDTTMPPSSALARPGRRRRRSRPSSAIPSAAAGAAITLLLVIAGTACGALGGGADTADPGSPGSARVVRVVDGDTLIAAFGTAEERVRLIGIDTPETKKPDTPVECFGTEASARLHELLPEGEALRLERDVEERDRYGRLLAYVYRAGDGLFVNEALVAQGYAAAATIPPNVAHRDDFASAARRARLAGAGLWSRCGGAHQPTTGPDR